MMDTDGIRTFNSCIITFKVDTCAVLGLGSDGCALSLLFMLVAVVIYSGGEGGACLIKDKINYIFTNLVSYFTRIIILSKL